MCHLAAWAFMLFTLPPSCAAHVEAANYEYLLAYAYVFIEATLASCRRQPWLAACLALCVLAVLALACLYLLGLEWALEFRMSRSSAKSCKSFWPTQQTGVVRGANRRTPSGPGNSATMSGRGPGAEGSGSPSGTTSESQSFQEATTLIGEGRLDSNQFGVGNNADVDMQETVWVSGSRGRKYHRQGCGPYLRSRTTVGDALQGGRKPCKQCFRDHHIRLQKNE